MFAAVILYGFSIRLVHRKKKPFKYFICHHKVQYMVTESYRNQLASCTGPTPGHILIWLRHLGYHALDMWDLTLQIFTKPEWGICPYGIWYPWVRGGWGLDALGKFFRRRRRRVVAHPGLGGGGPRLRLFPKSNHKNAPPGAFLWFDFLNCGGGEFGGVGEFEGAKPPQDSQGGFGGGEAPPNTLQGFGARQALAQSRLGRTARLWRMFPILIPIILFPILIPIYCFLY